MNKTIKNVIIKPYDKSLIGQRIVTYQGLSTITAVTKERVIYETDNGQEEWSWLYPNKQWATFGIAFPKNKKLAKALTLENAYRKLEKDHNILRRKLERYEKISKVLDQIMVKED